LRQYWELEKLKVNLDITTYCNAKCPQCNRTNKDGLERNSFVPLFHWTLPEVKVAFPKEEMYYIHYLLISGTWGDAIMNPEVYDIADYLCGVLPKGSRLQITTNGSIRDEDWWFKFSGLSVKHKGKLVVKFDIDGIDQEMHSYYRRNTSLDKVLKNMEAFSYNARAISQTIVFKHNQEHLKEIKELVEKHGSQEHVFVKSDRGFGIKEIKPYTFTDENGNQQILERADIEFNETFMTHFQDEIPDKKVLCKWGYDNFVKINFDGQVWPCCHFSDKEYHEEYDKFKSLDIIKEYDLMRLDNNIKFTPLSKILSNSWFRGKLQDSIENQPSEYCLKHCSTKVRPYSSMQHRTTKI